MNCPSLRENQSEPKILDFCLLQCWASERERDLFSETILNKKAEVPRHGSAVEMKPRGPMFRHGPATWPWLLLAGTSLLVTCTLTHGCLTHAGGRLEGWWADTHPSHGRSMQSLYPGPNPTPLFQPFNLLEPATGWTRLKVREQGTQPHIPERSAY